MNADKVKSGAEQAAGALRKVQAETKATERTFADAARSNQAFALTMGQLPNAFTPAKKVFADMAAAIDATGKSNKAFAVTLADLPAGFQKVKAGFADMDRSARVMQQARLSNRAFGLELRDLAGSFVPVSAAFTDVATKSSVAGGFLGKIGTKLTDVGSYARSFATHLKGMLIMAPAFALLGAGVALVGDAIVGLFQPTEEETKRMDALKRATEGYAGSLEQLRRQRDVGLANKAATGTSGGAIDQQIETLKGMREGLIPGAMVPSGAVKQLLDMGVKIKDLGEVGEKAFGDLARRTAEWEAMLRQAGKTAEEAQYLKQFPQAPQLVVTPEIAKAAIEARIKALQEEQRAEKQLLDQQKARLELVGQLATAYNRLSGITAAQRQAMEFAERLGFSGDLAGQAVSVYEGWEATVKRLAATFNQAAEARAKLEQDHGDAIIAQRRGVADKYLSMKEASAASVANIGKAPDAIARESEISTFKAQAQAYYGNNAAAIERDTAAFTTNYDKVSAASKAADAAAKADQDRAESISTLSNSLGAGMSTFIDSLGSGGDAVRAFAMSLANSLAQKGIDQLATSAATSFFAASSSTPGAPAPSYQHGGYNPVTQMALIHAGERVLNVEQTKAYDTGRAAPTQGRAGGSIQVHLHGITDAGGVRRSAYQLARQLERSQERRS